MKQSKNYMGFINDHSGSMTRLALAAMADYNTNIEAIKSAASREMLDTVVSVVAVGLPGGGMTERQIVNSNPHVLKPMSHWPTPGGTPLYDGIADMIDLLLSLPDATEPHVSFLVMVTTDGEECSSRKYSLTTIRTKLEPLLRDPRWTFVFRIPNGQEHLIQQLGIPQGNIQGWETSVAGMAAATQQTTASIDNYITTRAAGKAGSSSFFSDVSKVNLAALDALDPKKFSLYTVGSQPTDTDGMQIRDFILKRRTKYLKGAAFFQFVKSEAKVGYEKQVLIRDRATGKVFQGAQARTMIGLPSGQNARVHPGMHDKYDIFIQSSSINRKLPMGSGVIYIESLGTEFTQAEIDLYTKPAEPKRTPKADVPVQLPAVNNASGRPVHSTMPVKKQVIYFASRDDARRSGHTYKDNGSNAPKGTRWERT